MAEAFQEQSNYLKALTVYKELLEEKKIVLEDNHIEILETRFKIATVLKKLGKQNEFITLLEEIVKHYDEITGKWHPETITVKTELAIAYHSQNEIKKAAELFKNVCEVQKIILLQKDNEVLTVKHNLSSILIGDNLHPDEIDNLTKEINKNSGLKSVNIHEIKNNIEILTMIKSNSILCMAKESDVGKVYEIVLNDTECINISDDLGNTPLHYASQSGNTAVVKLLLVFGAIYIVKNKKGKMPLHDAANNNIKILLNLVDKLFRYVKSGNFAEVKKCIQQQKCIVNAKDIEGHNPLHWAASNGHISVLKLLLEAGADPTNVSNKGNTPLHIAVSKGFLSITEVLLQSVKYDELDSLINAQTLSTGAMALHVGAKKGFRDIIKVLLKHGAAYNVKNNEDKTPLELCEDKTSDVLKLMEELFDNATVGNRSIIDKLEKMSSADLTFIANACNIEGCTFVQVMINNNHKNLAFEVLQILKNLHDFKPWKCILKAIPAAKSNTITDSELIHFGGSLVQIKNFQKLGMEHLGTSDPLIYNLQFFCNLSPHMSEVNPCPSKTYSDGILYLNNALKLVKEYRKAYPNWTENVYIKQINDVLEYLEFNSEPNSEEPGTFIVKSTGEKFFNLLHSEKKKDLRFFIDLVEINIEIPMLRFLHTLTSQLCSFNSEALFRALEKGDRLNVEKYVKEDRTVLTIDVKGMSPLHYAIKHATYKIVKILIENGANTIEKVNDGKTLLHLAVSKGHKSSVELLLKHTYPDQVKNFVDAKTKVDGDTAIHLAAKNGFIVILKSLLKYGACYCIKNKQGEIPLDLASKYSNIRDLLKQISKFFEYAQGENFELVNIVRAINPEDLMVVVNAKNESGKSLLEVIKLNHLQQIQNTVFEAMLNIGPSALYQPLPYHQTSHEKICKAANTFSKYSELYLSKLRYKAQIYPDDTGKNPSPWSTLKEGSLYLHNVSRFLDECISCIGSVNSTHFLKIKETIEELQFDPAHVTSDYTKKVFGGKLKSFVSQGQGSTYYKLLYSEKKTDILQFINIVEIGIVAPGLKFLAEANCLIVTANPEFF